MPEEPTPAVRKRLLGFHPFREVPWDQLTGHFHQAAAREAKLRPLAELVDSILACGGAARLAGLSSMYDLLVTSRPVPADQRAEVIAVRTPHEGSHVLVEHLSYTGRNDRIWRPVAEIIPLFWRFTTEKFGVAPMCSRPHRRQ